MKYTLTIREAQLEKLQAGLVHDEGHERAAYLLCAFVKTAEETRLIVRSVTVIGPEDIKSSSPQGISIHSRVYVKALATADAKKNRLVLVHTHPNGPLRFSSQDDREESLFFKTAYIRAPEGPHASIIFVGSEYPQIIGRVWISEEEHVPLDSVKVLGSRLRIFDNPTTGREALPGWSDRQVRAFGESTQHLLRALHIGVVGAGGTGSAVCEQLIRLGVGKLTVIDKDTLEATNVTRLYGSRMEDVGKPKVEVVKRSAAEIGLATEVNAVHGSIADVEVARQLRNCDVIFGCTDDNLGRVTLNRLAYWYLIPVIDMGVAISSTNQQITSIAGRVTVLSPGNACLRCRCRINQIQAQAEEAAVRSTEEYEKLKKEGYAPELDEPDPSVIMFTTGIASRAVSELFHLLTGYLGNDRTTTEIIEIYHETEVRRNSTPGENDCFCMNPEKWGIGDEPTRFLGLN